MFKYSVKLTILFYLILLMVLMIACNGTRIIDLDQGEENIRILGDDNGDGSGASVASGDINGDGYDDIIIGAPTANTGGIDRAGETYVIFGGPSSPATIDLDSMHADLTIYGHITWGYSGYSVASSDINGDGFDDVIIGTSGPKKVYIIFGNATLPPAKYLNSQADMTISGNYWGFGNAVGSGDINNDGYDDIIIGAPTFDRPDPSYPEDPYEEIYGVGMAFVIFGSSSPSTVIDLNSVSADMSILGCCYWDHLGCSVTSSDVNGDGYDDVILGAYQPWWGIDSDDDPGKVYVFYGSTSPPASIDLYYESADIKIYGEEEYDTFGWSVASGDVNGDGYADIISGGYTAQPLGRSYAGKANVIFCNASLPPTINLNNYADKISILGDDEYELGTSVATGDINGDGYNDVIVGAPGADPQGYGSGKTYILYGKNFTTLPHTIDLNSESTDIVINGDDAEDWSGYAVASGNINGDNHHDIIIGAISADPPGRTGSGETYVIFGN